MDIQLTFINQSQDLNNSQILIFQKNVAADFDELAVAWRVIQNCGPGDNHPFVFPMGMELSVSDSYGNYTPQVSAQNGQLFHVTKTSSGDSLSYVGPASSQTDVQVRNDLTAGAINVSLYRDGKLLATKTGVSPGQKAVFEFKPTIWIGAVSQVVEGQVMDSAIISQVNTQLSLLGITRANIIMTGGGPNSTPLSFSLQDVVMATS